MKLSSLGERLRRAKRKLAAQVQPLAYGRANEVEVKAKSKDFCHSLEQYPEADHPYQQTSR